MAELRSSVDDDKRYRVKLKKVVRVNEHVAMTPTTDNLVVGKTLKTIPEDAIVSYEEV